MHTDVLIQVVQYIVAPIIVVAVPFIYAMHIKAKDFERELALLREAKADRADVNELKIVLAELRMTIGHNSKVLERLEEKL